MTDQKEDYAYHGYCTARVDDQKLCRNFELVEKTNGTCKHVQLGGYCRKAADIEGDKVFSIFDCTKEL